MRLLQSLLFLQLLLGLFATVAAQTDTDTTAIYRLTLQDGSELRGTIVRQDSSSMHFRSLGGVEFALSRSSITSLEPEEGSWRKGKFFRRDPNQTRLFFAPTGRTLPKGDGYFSVYQIFFPMIAIGPTDWLTVAAGMSLFPGATSQLVYIAPKVRPIHTEHFDLSVGVLYLSIPDVTDGVGITYGVVTTGSSTAAITFGLGWGFVGEEFGNAPSFVLGGEVQLSESVKLLTENWFPAEADAAVISFGIRFFGEHLAGDFGLLTTTEASGGFPFIPWVGFVYNF